MSTKSKTLWLLVATLCLVAMPATAQVCKITDTLGGCETKIRAAAKVEKASSMVKRKAGRSETGVDTSGVNLASNVKDFLPLLAATGLVGTDTDDGDTAGTVAVDLNFILPGEIKERNAQLKLVLNTEAELYAPLRSALDADGGSGDDGDDPVAELTDDITGIGEYSVDFSVNWRGAKLGRYLGPHHPLFASLVLAASPVTATAPGPDRMLAFLAEVPDNKCPGTMSQCTFEEAAGGDERRAEKLRDTFVALAFEDIGLEKTLETAMADNGLDQFAALVANQPQLSFSASYVGREVVVGPDEWSLSINYEHPLAPDVNGLKKELNETCRDDTENLDADQRKSCLDQYKSFLTDGNQKADLMTRLKNADRFTFSVEYVDREDLSILVPGETDPRTFNASRSLIGNLGWGRVLELNDDGTTRTRVDLVGSYEDVSDDPMRTDRGLLTLTITRDFGAYSIPFGIVWSNKPEFLAMQELDEQISAHVGIKYSIDEKSK